MKKYKEVYVINIDNEDFSITYDLKGNKEPELYEIKSLEIGKFPEPVAEHIKKHLAEKILNKRGVKTNYTDDLEKIINEISYDPET